MPKFKLIGALPQSAPGNTEYHYGRLANVERDGVYITLTDEADIANFRAGGRIGRPEEEVEVKKEVVTKEPEVVDEKPQGMNDVIENGSGKRGRPPKAAE